MSAFASILPAIDSLALVVEIVFDSLVMSPLNSLIFGLGLFFLGLQLVGENLRKLIGPGFRKVIKASTQSPVMGAGLGVGVGALMQSATAVTFILVSMTSSGLLSVGAAAPMVIWCNVGVTALAFVVNLNVHTLAAFVVGGAGIVMGMVRNPRWRTVAGALLGMGMILIGLEQMGSGMAPLKDAAWFRTGIDAATANWALAFVAGVAVAALLQSNTGAVMLIITLAGSGLIALQPAMLMIYGTNLGAIFLRLFLSAGLQWAQYRLVMLENFFCLASGVLMLSLYAVEAAGVPGVAALVQVMPGSGDLRLAMVFLLSNLVPALVLMVFLKPVQGLLKRFWPDKPREVDFSKPLYLHSPALDDPATALDLMAKELARLLSTVRVRPVDAGGADEPDEDFAALSGEIEGFAAKLAAQNTLDEKTATALHTRRAELSIIRHIEEGVRYYSHASSRSTVAAEYDASLSDLLALATEATAGKTEVVPELKARTKMDGDFMKGLGALRGREGSLGLTARYEDLAMAVWCIRRLAKLLERKVD